LLAGQLNAEDDEELQKELAELMGETPATATTSTVDLPDVPTHEIVSPSLKDAEEREKARETQEPLLA
jgi:hypothetical protein